MDHRRSRSGTPQSVAALVAMRARFSARSALLAGALACAGPGAPVVVESPIRPGVPPALEASVAARIERSLPAVAYRPSLEAPFGAASGDAAAAPRSGAPLRRVVPALDGDGRIVCTAGAGFVFGHCRFPGASAEPTRPRPPAE